MNMKTEIAILLRCNNMEVNCADVKLHSFDLMVSCSDMSYQLSVSQNAFGPKLVQMKVTAGNSSTDVYLIIQNN